MRMLPPRSNGIWDGNDYLIILEEYLTDTFIFSNLLRQKQEQFLKQIHKELLNLFTKSKHMFSVF